MAGSSPAMTMKVCRASAIVRICSTYVAADCSALTSWPGPLRRRPYRHRADIVADPALEHGEILLEPGHEVVRHRVIGGFVGPGLARIEHVVGNSGDVLGE